MNDYLNHLNNPETVRFLAFALGLSLMFVAESLWASRKWYTARLKRLGFHVFLAGFNTLIIRVVALAPFFFWVSMVESHGIGLSRWMGLTGATEILASLLVLDILDYWFHRLNHRINFLWRFHKVHHIDTHMDVSTALRFHPGELLISMFFKASWIALWGPSVWGFALFEVMVTLAAQFHHSNIRFSEGMERIMARWIVTPRYHLSHHTVARRTGNANFATILSCWDRVFGSYQVPDEKEMEHIGLAEGRADYLSLTATLCAPFAAKHRGSDESVQVRPTL